MLPQTDEGARLTALALQLGDTLQRLDMEAGDATARATVQALGDELILVHNDLLRHGSRLADLEMARRPLVAEEAVGRALWRELEAVAARITEVQQQRR
jgi:hypothetical protein